MAVKRSSGANSAMKASLVLMLLFGAVVAAHGAIIPKLTIANKACTLVTVNGKRIGPASTAVLNNVIDGVFDLVVFDVAGNVVGKILTTVPGDVTKVDLTYVKGVLSVQVGAVTGLLGGLLATVLGLVLGVVRVVLGC
jgi:hypothetical protein